MRRRTMVIGVALSLAAQTALAQGKGERSGSEGGGPPPPRMVEAARRDGPIHLDGRLDEPAWQAAQMVSDFTESYPDPGKAPPDRTTVRVLYDDAALYVGIRMYDAHPDSIAAQLARRDASGIYSDWVHLIIDSYHDRRTAFRFTVNPRGVEKDVYTSNDGNEDVNWDAVWQVGTRIDSLGWVAEYRIPFSQLRFGSAAPGADRVWGFQVMRDIARRNERDAFNPWSPKDPGFVSKFGDLSGLVNVPTPRRLELMPYASSTVTRAPGTGADPFYHATDARPSVGADVRVGLPAGLTLTGTVNPDFGQVEVDPAVVNLSAFETFFPEKRPFFLEGSDVFNFGQVLRQNDYQQQFFLYSRRIGRAPERSAAGPGVAYVDAPDQTTIAGAAKVTGKSGPWTMGLLDAVTTRETANIALNDGTQATTPVEPLTNYGAVRLRRDFRHGQTVIGAMATDVDRSMSDSVFIPLLTHHASFGGVDFEHRMAHQQWIVSGFLAGSRVDGSTQVMTNLQRNSARYFQRPDAPYLSLDSTRTSLGGSAGEVALQKGGTVFGSVAYKQVTPGYEMNDMGYLSRADYRSLSSLVGYQTFQGGRIFRQWRAALYHNVAWNFGGTRLYNGVAGFAGGTLNNFWFVNIGGGVSPQVMSDRLTRGGPLASIPRSWSTNVSVSTDSRRPIVLNVFGSYQHDVSGAHAWSVGPGVDARPLSNLHINISPSVSGQVSTAQFVRSIGDPAATATFGRRYVFANLDQTTVSLDTRIEWTLTPTLSLQTYIQPFVAAGAYTAFKEFTTPGQFAFAVYGQDQGTISRDTVNALYVVDPDGAGPAGAFAFGNPDFNVRSLRGNAVLRWEYRPGSALFFVWQQQRSDFVPIGDFDASRDIGAVFRAPATNVFLIKATYWIGH